MNYSELEEYYNHGNKETLKTLLESIGQKVFVLGDLEITSRVLTSWKQADLLPIGEKKGHARINVIELFWIQMIIDLREFGVQLSFIRKVKEFLFQEGNIYDYLIDEKEELKEESLKDNIVPYFSKEELKESFEKLKREKPEILSQLMVMMIPRFYGMVIDLLTKNINYNILITSNGEVVILKELESEKEKQEKGVSFEYVMHQMSNKPFISLSLRKYLYQLIDNKSNYRKIENLQLFEDVELEVIRAMRQGNLAELKILFDKKSKNKDLVYTYSESISMEDLNIITSRFKGKKHVGLVMKTRDGKTVQYEYQARKRYLEEK